MPDEDAFQIPVRHENALLVWSGDFDIWMNRKFPGKRFKINAILGAGQDTVHRIDVTSDSERDHDDARVFDQWLESRPDSEYDDDIPNLGSEELFNELRHRRLWPTGEFYIHVWW